MAALQSGSLKRKYDDAVYSSSSPSSHSEWDSDEDGLSDMVDFGPTVPFPSSHHKPSELSLVSLVVSHSWLAVHFLNMQTNCYHLECV